MVDLSATVSESLEAGKARAGNVNFGRTMTPGYWFGRPFKRQVQMQTERSEVNEQASVLERKRASRSDVPQLHAHDFEFGTIVA